PPPPYSTAALMSLIMSQPGYRCSEIAVIYKLPLDRLGLGFDYLIICVGRVLCKLFYAGEIAHTRQAG
ncbi:hypothetical protein NQZ68_019016, partial [Dissostichus eleginoides]